MQDIDQILAFEIKKEIADRYFGFRKVIEEDSAAYLASIVSSSLELEASFGLNLVRVYVLLHQQELIDRFQQLAGLPAELFFDPYILTSATIRRNVLTGLSIRGFTRRSRFKNLLCDLYQRLEDTGARYHEKLADLADEQETIREQINLFYRKNDLHGIMSFIRAIDQRENGNALMEGAADVRYQQSFEEKMKLIPPQPAADLLPEIPRLPPLQSIKRQLAALARSASLQQPGLDLKIFR